MRGVPSSLAIIGAGPAGIGLALALRQRLPEVSLEIYDAAIPRSTDDRPRIGESLPPGASARIEALGINAGRLLTDHLPFAGVSSLWGSPIPGHQDFWTAARGPGIHLDRTLFDHQLRQLAEAAGIAIHVGHRLVAVQSGDTADPAGSGSNSDMRLVFSCKGDAGNIHRKTVSCAFAVDASGVRAVLARRLGVARNILDRLVAISAILACPPEDCLMQGARGRLMAVHYGWWYAAPMPGGRWHVTLVSDRQAIRDQGLERNENWTRALEQASWLFAQLPAAVREGARAASLVHRSAPSAILSRVQGTNWLALGDAASSYDPLTSAGISKALEQADQAARVIAERAESGLCAPLARYEEAVFAAFRQYAVIRREFYQQAHARYPDAPFWRRRLGLAG